jgi:hypothetical protein
MRYRFAHRYLSKLTPQFTHWQVDLSRSAFARSSSSVSCLFTSAKKNKKDPKSLMGFALALDAALCGK